MESFNLYPVLSQKLFESIGYIPSEPKFSYFENDRVHDLGLKNSTGNQLNLTAEIEDVRCHFELEKHELSVSKSVTINSPQFLFGEKGIVPQNATIGVAVQWISSKSDHRGVFQLGQISKKDKKVELSSTYHFRPSLVRGSIILRTVLYLKEYSGCSPNEKHLCNQTGTIIGTFDGCEILVEGNGSIFPIVEINDPSKPLWKLYYDDSADPLQDAFDEEHVEIRLNKAHPSYDELKIDSSLKESPLFLEVISSALMIIIESAKNALGPDWDAVINDQSSFDRGSIAEAVSYFVTKLGWETSSPSLMAESIHNFFDNNLKGGNL